MSEQPIDRPPTGHDQDEPADSRRLWALLRAVAGQPATRPDTGFALDASGQLQSVDPGSPDAIVLSRAGQITAGDLQPARTRDTVALYAPLISDPGGRSFVLAHLGQSIDAQIATRSGDSRYVNGRADIVHLHRLRALSDAVLIGAGTAAADDPRLTTRLVEGPNPTRIVIDPDRRAPAGLGLFNDQAAPTLVVCARERLRSDDDPDRVIGVARDGDGLALRELVQRLAARGLRRLFVEGGGVTVTRWLAADCVDRLHLAVAPVLIGAGRPALQLPSAASMAACPRPPARVFRLGSDLLWDLDLRAGDRAPTPQPDAGAFWPVAVT